jgi:UDP-N-acetylmuramoyl-L-alanyl-D-glutamate--2,6-diaminopimelate ligase
MKHTSTGHPLIAVTGTNGKTGTILMLAFILQRLGRKPSVMDTWRGLKAFEQFRRAEDPENSGGYLVEVPVESLRQRQLHGNIFDCAALTNLSVDHLATCGSPEQYGRIKSRFFTELPPHAKAVIPADDAETLMWAGEAHPDFISCAVGYPHAMVTAKNIRYTGFHSKFDLAVTAELETYDGRPLSPATAAVRLPIPGRHNVANALTAATLALWLTGDLGGIADSFSHFPGIRRNLEMIIFDSFRIMDDSARNPAAIRAALTAVEDTLKGNIHVLHGIYGGGGVTVNRLNARELAFFLQRNPCSRLFVTRSMHHSHSRYQVRPAEEKAFLEELKKQKVEFYYYPDLPDACESCLSHSETGDLILMLGGPVLNRAREMMIRATGEKRASQVIIPSGFTALPDIELTQSLMVNPT